ncbi:uncharacterized protein TRIADDRAFT_60704 [Trichoplax adhaerens]|uniref:Uncharacterized protein n=1 Tax=Trichoplax adhaerens TaxID=10228 RepID=B3S955_TRIAD|nr:hypothetical protein TRIADDRAFT_60704 [Trichoplax adhaerens]EDV20740.1 hypothetical protein TRIADDRAFT_60704 [Trichoplax adhaerens]|eukprot:XP_002116681.1 hypothetical protein TRIADDRAFT_60704 [Trichoplax adhaerens]
MVFEVIYYYLKSVSWEIILSLVSLICNGKIIMKEMLFRYSFMIISISLYHNIWLIDNCWRFVTHLSGKPFLINHQLLALAVARQFNCQSSLQKKFVQFGGLRGLQNMLCSHVHRTMLQILKSGFNHHVEKDLFLEQIYVCGTLHGFVEFFRLEYIKTIMSWQLESGCFTSNHSDKDVTDLSNSQTEVSILLENRPETKLPDGCYQHMSALATSNIAAYIRWSSSKSRREVKTTPTPHPESKSLPFSVMIAIISVGAVIACILVIGIGYYAYLKSPGRSGYLRIKLEDDKMK